MPTNDFLPFCPTDTGTNLLSESDYLAATDRTSGNKPGVASSKLNNKAIRQATYVAGQLAQFLANQTSTDILDDNLPLKFLAQLEAAVQAFPPAVTKYTSGSGTHNVTYIFFIASGNATAAATYTNNAITFTVVATVASATIVKMTGSGAPTASGTLTKSGGTGDSSLTFYAVRAPLMLEVIMVGGGGGGAGSGGPSQGNGATGVSTTFGTALLSAGPGTGATGGAGGTPGAGGSSSLGSGPIGLALSGGNGSGPTQANNLATVTLGGAAGAASALGGGGAGGTASPGSGGVGAANTGGGGGGGGMSASVSSGASGASGGSGGFVHATITSPLSTYAYAVGTGGAAGSAGSSGATGGAGGSGVIMVLEHYN